MRRYLPSLDRLQALREVARTGGFSAAAETLGLTQPAVSNQIRQLEEQVGASLLERIGKTAKPTTEGEMLIGAAARAFAELETALDEIARLRAEVAGALVLATGATATKHLLPPVVADLRRRHPGIELRILTGNTAEPIGGVRDGSIDLGLFTAPIDEAALATRFFYRDRLVGIMPTAQAPGTRSIGPRDLEGRQLVLFDRAGSIRQAVDRWLAHADRRRIRATDIGSADAQIAFVRASYGWSIVSEIAAREDAAAGRIAMRPLAPALSRDLVLVWRQDRAQRPAISAALAIFTAHAAAAGEGTT